MNWCRGRFFDKLVLKRKPEVKSKRTLEKRADVHPQASVSLAGLQLPVIEKRLICMVDADQREGRVSHCPVACVPLNTFGFLEQKQADNKQISCLLETIMLKFQPCFLCKLENKANFAAGRKGIVTETGLDSCLLSARGQSAFWVASVLGVAPALLLSLKSMSTHEWLKRPSFRCLLQVMKVGFGSRSLDSHLLTQPPSPIWCPYICLTFSFIASAFDLSPTPQSPLTSVLRVYLSWGKYWGSWRRHTVVPNSSSVLYVAPQGHFD